MFILLGVMWAVVLVPMWLRKHDEANESRSVDRFSRALGSLSARTGRGVEGEETVVLSKPGKAPTPRQVLMPGRPRGAQDMQVTVTGGAAREGRSTAPGAAASPLTRRRRVLLGLLVVTAVVLVAGLLGSLPLWIAAVPALITVGFLVTVRRQGARNAEMARRRAHRETLSEAARQAQAQYDRPASRRRGARVPTPAAVAEPQWAAAQDAVVVADSADPNSWHAVPTTLPTYVTAPAATRVPRNIDRATPGSWSGAAMLAQARTTRHEEPTDDSGMRVESFEISVPRERVDSGNATAAYAERYVDTTAGADELAATDDEAVLEQLLDDPRAGVAPRQAGYRRAAG